MYTPSRTRNRLAIYAKQLVNCAVNIESNNAHPTPIVIFYDICVHCLGMSEKELEEVLGRNGIELWNRAICDLKPNELVEKMRKSLTK